MIDVAVLSPNAAPNKRHDAEVERQPLRQIMQSVVQFSIV